MEFSEELAAECVQQGLNRLMGITDAKIVSAMRKEDSRLDALGRNSLKCLFSSTESVIGFICRNLPDPVAKEVEYLRSVVEAERR